MDYRSGLILIACILAVISAGCTGVSQAPVTTSQTTIPAAPSAIPSSSLSAVPTEKGCTDDVCSFVPSPAVQTGTSLRIEASPRRYSPMMSSTPGIALVPDATGFNASAADYTWNASYGRFLSWDAPEYTVNQMGSTVSLQGKKIYWSFIDSPSSTTEPVVITVSAKDPSSGIVLGRSTLILKWDGDYAVIVQDIQ